MQVYPSTPITPDKTPTRVVAGFWRRIIALAIDSLIAALPCGILGAVFYDFFSRSEAYGFLVGFPLTLLYFGILGSSLGGGQTLGHKVTGIRVVDRNGKSIPLNRSLLRYTILLAPFLLRSGAFPISGFFVSKAILDWLMLVSTLAIIYLYIFNRTSRQSLHDLAADSYVVDADSIGAVESPPCWAGHWAILGGVSLATAALSLAPQNMVGQRGIFSELSAIQKAVLSSGDVQNAGVYVQKNWANGDTKSGLTVEVVWRGKAPATEKAAAEIAERVLLADPHAMDRDFITVNSLEGFRIGLATFSKKSRISHDPATWMKEAQSYGLR
jgi:uncharacterized RDD family membrane protein YckC